MSQEKEIQKKKGRYPSMAAASTFMMIKNLPFIFFLGFLGIIYIANAHYAEKEVRKIQNLQHELKEERWRYMSLKSDLMYHSKHSEIAQQVKELGLRDLKEKPYKIVIPERDFD